MLTGTITFTGKTLGDLEMAINEAKRLISDGNTCGANSNEDGEFSFNITGEEEIQTES